MMKLIILLIAFFSLMVAPAFAASDTNSKLFSFCSQNPDSAVCQDRTDQNKTPNTDPVVHIVRVASDIIALLTGVAAVIIIVLGGITMITSTGSAEAVANARKRIIYAVIGLVIVTLAWTLVAFVTDKFIQ